MRSRAKTKAAAGGNRCGQGRLDGVGMDLSGSPVSHVAFMIPQNPAAVKCHALHRLVDQALSREEHHRWQLLAAKRIRRALERLLRLEGEHG